jgi:tryptophan-rich sensory protein
MPSIKTMLQRCEHSLCIAIVATLVAFWRISPPAGLLLLPYGLWVSFATALNFTIWRLNR